MLLNVTNYYRSTCIIVLIIIITSIMIIFLATNETFSGTQLIYERKWSIVSVLMVCPFEFQAL